MPPEARALGRYWYPFIELFPSNANTKKSAKQGPQAQILVLVNHCFSAQ
jgi:hypothetical protein